MKRMPSQRRAMLGIVILIMATAACLDDEMADRDEACIRAKHDNLPLHMAVFDQMPTEDKLESELARTARTISAGPVDVIEAVYGANCGAPRGNATWSVEDQCDGLTNCAYHISVGTLGDPAHGCDKDFDVRWACGTAALITQHVAKEANNKTVTLTCENVPSAFGSIYVQNATYGGNCGQPNGNVTWDVAVCNGFGSCRYDIRVSLIGDPAHGCDKEFYVNYTCSNHPTVVRREFASREANGKTVSLTCPE